MHWTQALPLLSTYPEKNWHLCSKKKFMLFESFHSFVSLLTPLGLRCFARTFSSCSMQGLLFLEMCGLLIGVALGMRASVIVTHGLCCSLACGITQDQGLNLCPLPWQADSYPQHHQGSSSFIFWAPTLCVQWERPGRKAVSCSL